MAREQLRQREERLEAIRHYISAGTPLEQLEGRFVIPRPCLGRFTKTSPLSPVLGRPSIWTDTASVYKSTNWPSLRELKDAGNTRSVKGRSRFFPAPRISELDGESVAKAKQSGVSHSEPNTHGTYHKIAEWALLSVRYDCLMAHEVQ
ncbi:hypothetical protein F5X97DRAFT_288989 [Nemania serpens]|nr:hypothetical protein F5X97DRAFT_288989 [Nemania serpens]